MAEARTIPVHALADARVHLAPAHLGRLRQGQLKTLCGLVAVTALSPFVLAEPDAVRCPLCFRGAGLTPAKPKGQKAGAKTATGSKGTGARGRRSKPR